jgi:hypothetical protein
MRADQGSAAYLPNIHQPGPTGRAPQNPVLYNCQTNRERLATKT